MQTDMREKTFNMRLSPEEWTRFEAVAEDYGLPVASMIRLLVKREEETIKRRHEWLPSPGAPTTTTRPKLRAKSAKK